MAEPRPLSYDEYKQLLAAGQKYVAQAQAADPEWQAWQQDASRYTADMGPAPASPDKDYWSQYMSTLPPEVQADFQRHMADSTSWTDTVGSVLKVAVPALVGGAALAATGALGTVAQGFVGGASLGSTALAEAGVVATFDTLGSAFGSAYVAVPTSGVAGAAEAAAAIAAAGGSSTAAGAAILAEFAGSTGMSITAADAALAAFDAAVPASAVDAAAAATTAATTASTVGSALKGVVDAVGGIPGLINAGLGVAAAVTAAQAAKDQAEEDQRTAEYNAQEAEHAARNALQRGEEEARDLRRSGSLLQGAQRSSYAGRGVSLNEGTPAAAVKQTDFFTDQDMSTARSNAATEAATYRRQGARFNAQAGYINPSRTGGLALVGGLATVASRWYDRYGN